MRPSFDYLTPDQQALFGNGVGPFWWPAGLRAFITAKVSWFFSEASWRHHDFGYVVGGDRWDRARCDWKFFEAMLCDAVSQSGDSQAPHWRDLLIVPAILISIGFFVAVRIGGQFGSFRYSDRYATALEVIEFSRRA